MEDPKKQEEAKQSLIVTAKKWGGRSPSCISFPVRSIDSTIVYLFNLLIESPLPPAVLATLVFAQHARPFQTVPMLFPPLLLFSTYLNISGYKIDSAGTTAALSGSYLVLAGRRSQGVWNKFGTRGVLRGTTMGLCLANVIGGGLAYTFGSRSKEDDEKKGI